MKYFETPSDLTAAVEDAVVETDVVLDIGCGIVPMNYFRPKLHIMQEPWREYSDILTYRHAGDKSVIVLRQTALDGLRTFSDQSIDSIFMLDVIEHMPKAVGFEVLDECQRVARRQIVVFTPLGFMPQCVNFEQEKDGWGLNGFEVQEHLSGWLPTDFPSTYEFFICERFHTVDFRGATLPQVFGAFYAVCNVEEKAVPLPTSFSDIRRPLPIEIKFQVLQSQHEALQEQHEALWETHQALLQSKAVRTANRLKRLIGRGALG